MKICKLIIRGFQQFKHTDLDFTSLETGKPGNRICLIGRNGTGKSTVLRILHQVLRQLDYPSLNHPLFNTPVLDTLETLLAVKIESGTERIYLVYGAPTHQGASRPHLLYESVESIPGWVEGLAKTSLPIEEKLSAPPYDEHRLPPERAKHLTEELRLKDDDADLLVYAPPETQYNTSLTIDDLPDTNLDKALELFKRFPCHHIVSNETLAEVWRVLVYFVKKRESDREAFENREENLSKTKAELIAAFEGAHPDPLREIAGLWNGILERAGLEFDVEGARRPIQLNDNLRAYIRIKSTKDRISYNQLSSGIRDFIFRLGHIFLLYFGRNIERGFLLIDEPENSLFPDFLFDLMETYNRVVQNDDGRSSTQMFFATHSPIVAAQFHPHERIILEWDDNSHVTAKKGRAPIGDDPNDLLKKDFELPRLMGREGEAKWLEYVELKKKIRRTENKREKEDLIASALEIGQSYNFPTTGDK